ncbi:MAG: hypothetical protein LBU51_03745 [Bacteroidales bacterium]|jgi:hypothetical protein|nr:hypothetical protein [Bacteroidales bacterium]
MSYDLMVFRKEAAPKKRIDFLEWYKKQIEWSEGYSYDDSSNTSPELRNWYIEMKQIFPPMNGPDAPTDKEWDKLEKQGLDSYATDYVISGDFIYAAFAWSVAKEAYKTMYKFAEKYEVGFFDVSSESGNIFFPENGKLKKI